MKNKLLYYFNSDSHILFEIKLDLKNEKDKSKIYNWILYDNDKKELKKLDFVSMIENERIFDQGRFIFNSHSGFLFLKNEKLIFNRNLELKDIDYNFIDFLSAELIKNIK